MTWLKDSNTHLNKSKHDNSKSDKSALLYGNFEPDKRMMALEDRLALYYERTPKEISNEYAIHHWMEFKQWCKDYDFTQAEINRAKISPRFKDV